MLVGDTAGALADWQHAGNVNAMDSFATQDDRQLTRQEAYIRTARILLARADTTAAFDAIDHLPYRDTVAGRFHNLICGAGPGRPLPLAFVW